MKFAIKHARQIVILIIGVSLVALGLALLVLPGPGVLIFAVGLGVLSLEFVWARQWLAKVRRGISRATRHQRINR